MRLMSSHLSRRSCAVFVVSCWMLILSGHIAGQGRTIGDVHAVPTSIAAYTSTDVTFTARITDSAVIPASVTLAELDSSGRILRQLGVMRDDGVSPDATAGDGLFTVRSAMAPTQAGSLTFRASAAFTGTLLRAQATVTLTVTSGSELPPDPSTIAPPLTKGVVPNLADSVRFLYDDPAGRPIQRAVLPNAIDRVRASALRGRVLTRDGMALNGVRVSILGRQELGWTLSRADGWYDMAVNGGAQLTVHFERNGYLPAQRHVTPRQQDFAHVPDVALVPPDSTVSRIVLSSPSVGERVAQGREVSDNDGVRRSRLLFPSGTNANMVLSDGTRRPLTTLSVRSTEFTVGPNGPTAMPAQLPPTSGYTYAAELRVDEAAAAGAVRVEFSRPVIHYLENFLEIPVGSSVPTGYYDYQKGGWTPEDDGRVIRILRTTQLHLPVLDIDGSGTPASAEQLTAIGYTLEEGAQLVRLYSPGQSLWRVPLRHFSTIDHNFAVLPDDSEEPPKDDDPDADPPDPSCRSGSIVECETRTLIETHSVLGTPYHLTYRSDNVPGNRTISVKLTGQRIPRSLVEAEVSVDIAGQHSTYRYPRATLRTNQVFRFTWDGLDAYGRAGYSDQFADVTVQYWYTARFGTALESARSFAAFGGRTSSRRPGGGGGGVRGEVAAARVPVAIFKSVRVPVRSFDARGIGLGGWMLSAHHSYDAVSRKMRYGDGRIRSIRSDAAVAETLSTVIGGGTLPLADGRHIEEVNANRVNAAVVGPDGAFYFIIAGLTARVWRADASGVITAFAGSGVRGYSGDGGPAVFAQLQDPRALAFGPDGSLYIADQGNLRIRRVSPSGIITTVAGNGKAAASEYQDDGSPATSVPIHSPRVIAVDTDGLLYFVHSHRIRRVAHDGTVETVAGADGNPGYGGDGGQAADARFGVINGLAFMDDGSLLVLDGGSVRLRRIRPSGIVETVAGTGVRQASRLSRGNGGPAILATFAEPNQLAVAADGTIYVLDSYEVRRLVISGDIDRVSGGDLQCPLGEICGDGGPALLGRFSGPASLSIAPDQSLLIADPFAGRVRRVASALPGVVTGHMVVPREDGSELYEFDAAGHHVRTIHPLTGATLLTCEYHSDGRLSAVTDGNGNRTELRSASSAAQIIIGPFGQRTTLEADANGFLARIADPGGATIELTSSPAGLLETLTDGRGNSHVFSYDGDGKLRTDRNAAGGSLTLSYTKDGPSYEVQVATPLNRRTRYVTQRFAQLVPGGVERGVRQITIDPAGLQTELISYNSGWSVRRTPDGMVVTTQRKPDPRWGMAAPISDITIVAPGGQTLRITTSRSVVLSEPADPLSVVTIRDDVLRNDHRYVATYTGASRTLSVTTPEGRSSRTEIDTLGRPVERQWGTLDPVHYTYDANGRLSSATQGSGSIARSMTATFGDAAWVGSVTNGLGEAITFEHDDAGRVSSVRGPDAATTRFGYDANGNQTSITVPTNRVHQFSYTPIDLTASYTPPAVPNTGRTSYTYNVDRQLTRVSRPDGRTVTLSYDAAGRLGHSAAASGAFVYGYSPATGLPVSVTDPTAGVLTYSWNGALLSREERGGSLSGSLERAYDSDFRVASLSVNDGASEIGYDYDGDGLLVRAGELSVGRDDYGLPREVILGSTIERVAFSAVGELTSQQVTAGRNLYSVVYERDRLGRIQRRTEVVEGVSAVYVYAYSAAGRLVSVTKDGVQVESYTYDANGNRQIPGAAASYDAQDRLLRLGSTTYTYSPGGELQSRTRGSGDRTTYSYDEHGNLLEVASPGQTVQYIIDGLNRRVGTRVNGVLVKSWIYQDALRIAAELDANGNIVSRFVYTGGSNVPAYMVRGGVQYRFVTDHVGSVRLVVNAATGAVVQRFDYDAYGRVLDSSGTPGFQPFGFAGGMFDHATGLVRLGARDYDPEVGRWAAKDPVAFAGGDTNLYSYVGGDPANLIDPTGLKCDCPPVPTAPSSGNVAYNIDIAKDYSWFEPGSAIAFVMIVGNYGVWDYKRLNKTKYEEFGNFNFGAVAAAMGFPEYVAQNGAGIYQLLRGAREASEGIPIVKWPYGDESVDAKAIHAGYQYFLNGCYK